jgi:hypothetical protein
MGHRYFAPSGDVLNAMNLRPFAGRRRLQMLRSEPIGLEKRIKAPL